MLKACGVGMAISQGQSWAPTLLIDSMVNVGTIFRPSVRPHIRCGGGQARCRPMVERWGGVAVVVRGRESRLLGEGRQRDRSLQAGMPGGRQ